LHCGTVIADGKPAAAAAAIIAAYAAFICIFIAITYGVKFIGIGKEKTNGVKCKLQQGIEFIKATIGGGGKLIDGSKLKSSGTGN
jgi:hypothetical protein